MPENFLAEPPVAVFCSRVRERRQTLGLTLQAFGDMVGMCRQSAHGLETGRFPRDEWRIVAIARALDTSLNYLFGLVDDPDAP